MEAHPFEQSETPYFHAVRPRQMLQDLAAAPALSLYCGAGVTIDRTGLGWTDLIQAIFGPTDDATEEERADIKVLLDRVQSAPRVASALYARELDRLKSWKAVQSHLTPLLAHRLYKANGWQEGLLTQNVARLALYAAHQGKSVRVFTTNYDTYLEQAFSELQDQMEAEGLHPVPGVKVRAVGVGHVLSKRGVKAGSPHVELVYLHGRVGEEGGHQGAIVLTEEDYRTTYSAVRKELVQALNVRDTGFLAVGSSLVDAPLLDALHDTRDRRYRFALVPVESMGFTEYPPSACRRLTDRARKRGDMFGLKISCPDFKFQVAQVCAELLLAITQPGTDVFDDKTGLRYGLRLTSWWNTWTKLGGPSPDEELWSQLSRLHRDVGDIMKGASDTARLDTARGEQTRIELWVRNDPANQRSLALWGTSEGPIKERGALRSSPIGLRSSNASVAAFVERRPKHLNLSDLRESPSSGRWRSFLSVPVVVATAHPTSDIPVGVVTLASTHEIGGSLLPLDRATNMESLVSLMQQRGRRLLRAN